MLQMIQRAPETHLRNTGHKMRSQKHRTVCVVFKIEHCVSSTAYRMWRHSKDEGRNAGG